MKKKDPISSFTYCPLCATPLEITNHNHCRRNICPTCDFVDWHNPSPAAGAVLVEQGRLLLVERADYPRQGDWCIPAGFIEWDESPADCAVRELKEETGLEIEVTGLFNVYSGNDDPRTNALLILYFGRIVGGEAQAGDDAAAVEFFSLAEIPDNIAFAAHIQAIADLQRDYPDLLK